RHRCAAGANLLLRGDRGRPLEARQRVRALTGGLRHPAVSGLRLDFAPGSVLPSPRLLPLRARRCSEGGSAMRRTFQGSLVAMVTPFHDGKVDEGKLRDLVEFHVAHGTDGLVPCGTTGESPTLTHDEHKRVVEIVIQQARGRIPVVAGT